MKVSVDCSSLLLKKSLEIFLKEYLTTYKQSDLVISDRRLKTDKPIVVVGYEDDADITIPFSKSSLLEGIKNKYHDFNINKNKKDEIKPMSKDRKSSTEELWKLERKIDKILLDFRENILQVIREFYER